MEIDQRFQELKKIEDIWVSKHKSLIDLYYRLDENGEVTRKIYSGFVSPNMDECENFLPTAAFICSKVKTGCLTEGIDHKWISNGMAIDDFVYWDGLRGVHPLSCAYRTIDTGDNSISLFKAHFLKTAYHPATGTMTVDDNTIFRIKISSPKNHQEIMSVIALVF